MNEWMDRLTNKKKRDGKKEKKKKIRIRRKGR
jgi:hypothetical protein